MNIVVIVLNWNRKADTLRCLTSLKSIKEPHSIVVVDNGSTDSSAQAIAAAFPEVHLIETGENLGYAEGNNVGLRHALEKSPDAVLILNNDTVADKDLLHAFQKRDLPIQAAMQHQLDRPGLLGQLGGKWNSDTGMFDAVGLNDSAQLWTEAIELDYVSGCALFVRTDVFRRVGLFDARFFLFWEECDWCFRAARCGYPSHLCPEAIVYHQGSASFVGGLPHQTYYWWRNRLLWIELHYSKVERRRLIRKMVPSFCLVMRRYVLKSMQSWVVKSTPQRRLRLLEYRAQIAGIRDYFLRKFGKGPSWLAAEDFRPNSTERKGDASAVAANPRSGAGVNS